MNKLSTTVAFLEHELSEIRLILERKTGVLIQTPTEKLSEIIAEHLDALLITRSAARLRAPGSDNPQHGGGSTLDLNDCDRRRDRGGVESDRIRP